MMESTISTKTQTAYIYNKHYKQCLYNKGEYGSRPVLADCSNANQYKWIVPIEGTGFYRSAYNTTSCLYVSKVSTGSIVVSDCNHRSLMQDYKKSYGGEAIWSTMSDNLCLGLLSSDAKSGKVNLNTCNTDIKEQHWSITTTLPSEGRCGKEFGNKKCPNNQCCSTHGWCGTTNDYCAKKNCQTSFGKCNKN